MSRSPHVPLVVGAPQALARRRPGRVFAVLGSAALTIGLAGCVGPRGGEARAAEPVGFAAAPTATVRVTADGAFLQPGASEPEPVATGTGFIVDPSGLAVTTNHVVLGAESLTVNVDGREYPASLVGSAECLDLAVIDIEGERFPFLRWFDGQINRNLDVWAVGYDPEATPRSGPAMGSVGEPGLPWNTPRSSVDSAIIHDARFADGGVGGPLITSSGRVVGVNYAFETATDTYYAIHRDTALNAVEDLMRGVDVLSIGVDGVAVVGNEALGTGVFVRAVAPGSPADEAGIDAGDVIRKFAGISQARDGTLASQCATLRMRGASATVPVEIFRPSDGETYVGQVNGAPLEAASLPALDGGTATPPTGTEVVVVQDDSRRIALQVPATWSQVDGRPVADTSGVVSDYVAASSDLTAFGNTWTVSGISVTTTTDVDDGTVNAKLDAAATGLSDEQCTRTARRVAYQDAVYTGSYDVWTGCGGVGTSLIVIAAAADGGSHLVTIQLQVVQGDEWVLEPILGSVIGTY